MGAAAAALLPPVVVLSPVVSAPADAFAAAGAGDQLQSHVLALVGAASCGTGSPSVQFHVQTHGSLPSGPAMGLPSPSTTTVTLTSVASVVLVVTEAASAVELLVCATVPSVPGLATRTETFTFVGATWLALAVVSVGTGVRAAGAAAGSGGDEGAQPLPHCASD